MKPGWKTSEFWLTIAGDVAGVSTATAGVLPLKWAAIAIAVAHLGYAISRGNAKRPT